jgi:predicted TIM-barrel fold metal-dependent hydrolase
VERLCTDFPGLRLVLLGLSYREDPWLFPLLRRFETLYVCLGHFYIPAHGPMRFLEHFPADRLLFGSGLPFFSPGGLIAHVTYADIPDGDKEKILSGNITRLMSEVQL